MSGDPTGNDADIDFSVIRTAIELGGKPIEQILNGVHYGSPEVRCLLLDECNLIIECKVCRALFRGLPLFIAHKRVYCTKAFQESQPPLFETKVSEEAVVIQPTAPEDDQPPPLQPVDNKKTPEESLNQLVEQIKAGKAGASDEYKFYSKVSALVEKRKEATKTVNLQLNPIPSNKNAVVVTVLDGSGEMPQQEEEIPDEKQNTVNKKPKIDGVTRLEMIVSEKILPKCLEDNTVDANDKIDVIADLKLSGDSEKIVVPSKTKDAEEMTESGETPKCVDTQKHGSWKECPRENKPSLRNKVCELPDTDQTLDLSALKCLKCQMSYSSKKTLMYHYQMRHSQLRTFFPCPYCSNIFFYFWGLTRHMMKIHKKSKNQIDRMREKLRKRSFTKCITKSCNIAKDQLQFVADEDDDSHANEPSTSVLTSASTSASASASASASTSASVSTPKSSKHPQHTQNSKKIAPAKSKGDSAIKGVKNVYCNEYEMPKMNRQIRVSLKEGLRNSKNKESKSAIVKRSSEPPRVRHLSEEVNRSNQKNKQQRKSDSPRQVREEEPSAKSKEKALDELQKKLTEAATVPVTRSSSSERQELKSSEKHEATKINTENKTTAGNAERENKSTEASAGLSSQVPEKQQVVSASPPVTEKKPLQVITLSVTKSSTADTPQSVQKDSSSSEILSPILSSLERPEARRRQIQIGTRVVPQIPTDTLISLQKQELMVSDQFKEHFGLTSQLVQVKLKPNDSQKISDQGSGGTAAEKSESKQLESEDGRSRPARRRTLTTKAQAFVNECQNRKNDGSDGIKQGNKVNDNSNQDSSRNVKQNKKPVSDTKEGSKTVETSCRQKEESTSENKDVKDEKNKSKNMSGKPKISESPVTVRQLETRSVSKDRNKKDTPDKSHVCESDSEVPESGNIQDADSASSEGTKEMNDDGKASLKESRLKDMSPFTSSPGSKPLIKHSRVKKTNEFVVRCLPSTGKSDSEADGKMEEETVGMKDARDENVHSKDSATMGDATNDRASKDSTTKDSATKDLKTKLDKDERSVGSTADDVADDVSVKSTEDNSKSSGKSTSKGRYHRCCCGRGFLFKIGLINHMRTCKKTEENDGDSGKTDDGRKRRGSSTDRKRSDSPVNMATENSGTKYLYICKCGKELTVKAAYLNHQKVCWKRSDEDASGKKTNRNRKQNMPEKTSSTRRKGIARKVTDSQRQAAESREASSTTDKHVKLSVGKSSVSNAREIGNSQTFQKKPEPRQSEMDNDYTGPPPKQMRVIEEIWVDKVPGKPVERVKSNRIYVVRTEGSGKMQCQDTRKLCDIADEVNMKCLVCLQEFTSVSNLRRHAIRHLGWKRYKCKMCRFSSYNKSECNTHILRTHSEKFRSAAATDNMIVDLNREACRLRSQKKNQTLRKACEKEGKDETVSQRKYQQCGVPENSVIERRFVTIPRRKEQQQQQQQQQQQCGPSPNRKKPAAVVEENVLLPQTTFNISTRKSPRQFDTRPYREVDQMTTLYTRKGYYPKANNIRDSESSEGENVSHPSESSASEPTQSSCRQKRRESGSERFITVDESDHSYSQKDRHIEDTEWVSDGEFVPVSKGKVVKKRCLSAETKDMGYSSDSCLTGQQLPESRCCPKTKNNSSNYPVSKNRKLSGGSGSTDRSPTPHVSGTRPVAMMSIQDMFELIKPKPKPERKSFARSNKSDSDVKKVLLEGAVNTRSQESFPSGDAPSTSYSSGCNDPEDNTVVIDCDDDE